MVDKQWGRMLRMREGLMSGDGDALTAGDTPKRLVPLSLRIQVRVQNETSNLWDRTGIVTEVLGSTCSTPSGLMVVVASSSERESI